MGQSRTNARHPRAAEHRSSLGRANECSLAPKEDRNASAVLKEMRIGAYVLKQKLMGRQRYPLVLMLEPLFRCNLACFGCGKIDYPIRS